MNKFIKPPAITETISLTHLLQPIKHSIYQTLNVLVNNLGEYESDLKRFGKLSQMEDAAEWLSGAIAGKLTKIIPPALKTAILSILPNTVTSIVFDDIGGTANAYLTKITLSNKLAAAISDNIVYQLFREAFHQQTYVIGRVVSPNVTSAVAKKLNTGDIKKMVDQLARGIVHEMVHVTQNTKQEHRDRREYRSYFGHKEEFPWLHRVLQHHKFDPTHEYYPRWEKLYRASPQEISAFVHDISTELIDRYQLDSPRTYVEPDTIRYLMPDIGKEIRKYIQPSTRLEHKIFNRYAKLTYLELKQYLDDKMASEK